MRQHYSTPGRRRGGRRTSSGRPVGTRVALAVAVLGFLLVAGAVALPVYGVIGGADAASGGVLDVPVGRIVAVTLLCLVVVAVAVVGLLRTANPGVAWALAVAVLVVSLVGAVYPLLTTGASAVRQGEAFVPWVTRLVSPFVG